jgi:hypothetical protein
MRYRTFFRTNRMSYPNICSYKKIRIALEGLLGKQMMLPEAEILIIAYNDVIQNFN